MTPRAELSRGELTRSEEQELTDVELRQLIRILKEDIDAKLRQCARFQLLLAERLCPFRIGDVVRKEKWPDYEVKKVYLLNDHWAIDARKIDMRNAYPLDTTFTIKDRLVKAEQSRLLI